MALSDTKIETSECSRYFMVGSVERWSRKEGKARQRSNDVYLLEKASTS